MKSMNAASTARGNVLEPEGMIEIKFRQAQLIKLMHRFDREFSADNGIESSNTKAQREREKQL